MNDTSPADVLTMLYNYRVSLWQHEQGTAPAPIPPTLTTADLVNAYGLAMSRYGQEFVPFADWLRHCNRPQPPRRFMVVGGA
jgi:hypothetical protein